MSFHYSRTYRGPVKSVIFDWAGTTVDFGCCAPAAVFIELFKRHGVDVTVEEARGPMGMHKRDHIRILSKLESVARQWTGKHGQHASEEDVEALFTEFLPMQVDAIKRHADVIPGSIETMAVLRNQGVKIGSTTGYNAEMMAALTPLAAATGYVPDTMVCVSEVPEGRPAPWMALEAAKRLGSYPVESNVKVGDTVSDIEEGLNAGMWSIGLVEHGNEVGLSHAEFVALSASDRVARVHRARRRLTAAGAHYTLDSIRDVPDAIRDINSRLSRGERP